MLHELMRYEKNQTGKKGHS